MRVIYAVLFLLLFAWVARADYSLREVDKLEEYTYALRVYCDASRGNIVYVAHVGGYNGIGVAVVHQPDACK
jgi:hypothetical protein